MKTSLNKNGCHLSPAFDQALALVLASDENYAAPLGVALTSLVLNSSSAHNYDLIVLWPNEGGSVQTRLMEVIAGRDNFSLRFFNMESFWPTLSTVGPDDLYIGDSYQLAAITYYRLFISSVLKEYERAVYLDPDVICLTDVAELMAQDMEGAALKAARDHWALLVLREPYGRFLGWAETLALKNQNNYFNAGVMLMDLNRWRLEKLEERSIERLKQIKTPRYYDQDILNHVCQENLKPLDPAWNCLGWWGQVHGNPQIEDALPQDLRPEYDAALGAPKILHYLNSRKPWLQPYCNLPLADSFRRYASLSPFAAELRAVIG